MAGLSPSRCSFLFNLHHTINERWSAWLGGRYSEIETSPTPWAKGERIRIDNTNPYFFLPVGFGLAILVLIYRIAVVTTGSKSGLGETQHQAFQDREAE